MTVFYLVGGPLDGRTVMIPQPILTHGPISWAGGRFANGSGYTTTDSRDHVLVWTTDLPDLPELPNLGEVFGTNANN